MTKIFSPKYLASLPEFQNSASDTWQVRIAKSPEFENYRNILERYFNCYPPRNQNDYLRRLRNGKDYRMQKAAANELIVLAIFDALKIEAEFQPLIRDHSPDFMMKDHDAAPVIVEVFTQFSDPQPYGGRWVPSNSAETEARINEKRKKFRQFASVEMKFVTALFNDAYPPLTIDKIEDSLYGTSINLNGTDFKRKVQYGKHYGGFFFCIEGGVQKNTSIAGLLYIKTRQESCLIYNIRFYHNPNARLPVGSGLFEKIPQFMARSDGSRLSGKWSRNPTERIDLNILTS